MAGHVCPWWLGYFLITPLRRILQSPEKILGSYVKPGMTVLEVGPGMGYFSLWMADAVGADGKVVCVDVQEKMIRALKRRAAKAGVDATIDARVCGAADLGVGDLDGQVDFCLVFAVAHEIDDVDAMFEQLRRTLKPNATCLVAEPKGHVGKKDFDNTIGWLAGAGFRVVEHPSVARSHAALLQRE